MQNLISLSCSKLFIYITITLIIKKRMYSAQDKSFPSPQESNDSFDHVIHFKSWLRSLYYIVVYLLLTTPIERIYRSYCH